MNVWQSAAALVARHLQAATRLDALFEALPAQATALDRRRCRQLVYGVVRHRRLLDHAVHANLHRRPRPKLHAALLVGAFELLENPESAPAIVHHAVAQTRAWTTPAEARVVNAVLRRVSATLGAIVTRPALTAAELALRHSHPDWLVGRWLARWGETATRRLLEWNQEPAPVHARVLTETALPAGFVPTPWPGFLRLEQTDWEGVERLLATGAIYLQDPATSVAPELLGVRAGEAVLDLCAAPGGKAMQLAAAAGPEGRVVAVDLPGQRLARLEDNLARHPNLPIRPLAADVTTLTPEKLAAAGLPAAFDAVLLDAPCSNTGVLRHRVDVKWRLTPRDLETLPALQLTMLTRAATLVRPGGRLVYSTCSLEPEENDGVVERFLAQTKSGFRLERFAWSRPWEDGRDGAGAFLLVRTDG